MRPAKALNFPGISVAGDVTIFVGGGGWLTVGSVSITGETNGVTPVVDVGFGETGAGKDGFGELADAAARFNAKYSFSLNRILLVHFLTPLFVAISFNSRETQTHNKFNQ